MSHSVRVFWTPSGTIRDLAKSIVRSGPYDVLHFFGQTGFDSKRAAGGVLARRPEILFVRHTLPPATGEELFRPHSAADHRTTTPRSPRMAAMRAAPSSSLR